MIEYFTEHIPDKSQGAILVNPLERGVEIIKESTSGIREQEQNLCPIVYATAFNKVIDQEIFSQCTTKQFVFGEYTQVDEFEQINRK